MAVYAYEGIGVIIPSETSITKPRLFPKILIVCLVVSSFQYVVFGCLVYLGFGVDTQEQILLNVAAFAGDNHVWIVSLMIITVLYVSSRVLQLFLARPRN
jgi:amino acid permease